MHRSEFVDGMHRLVLSSDFQKACLTQLGLGQVQELNHKLSAHVCVQMAAEFKRLRRQNRTMKAELLAEIQGRRRPNRRGRLKRAPGGVGVAAVGASGLCGRSSSSSCSECSSSDRGSDAAADSAERGADCASVTRRSQGSKFASTDVQRTDSSRGAGAAFDETCQQTILIHVDAGSHGEVAADDAVAADAAFEGSFSRASARTTGPSAYRTSRTPEQEHSSVGGGVADSSQDVPRENSCPPAWSLSSCLIPEEGTSASPLGGYDDGAVAVGHTFIHPRHCGVSC